MEGCMSDFEQVFDIPEGHTLKETSFRRKGTLAQDEFWKHEEYDAAGNLVARYESWSCTSIKPPFRTQSGFRKYSPSGSLLLEKGN
jgi:hypothetical protein